MPLCDDRACSVYTTPSIIFQSLINCLQKWLPACTPLPRLSCYDHATLSAAAVNIATAHGSTSSSGCRSLTGCSLSPPLTAPSLFALSRPSPVTSLVSPWGLAGCLPVKSYHSSTNHTLCSYPYIANSPNTGLQPRVSVPVSCSLL